MTDQLIDRLSELAKIGAHEHGINRPLLTPQERAARELFARWAREGGYALTQDAVGNLFARYGAGEANAKPILTGSHLDTVPTGGAYDGAYGVVGAMCALDALREQGAALRHPVEAVAWVGEEGSRFPLGCLGSSVFTGLVPLHDVVQLADDDGIRYGEALADKNGGLLPSVPLRANNDVAAYLELHIEQGPVLDTAGVSLGVVTAIAAQRRYRVTVDGQSGHAGTVPMEGRADALSAACELILTLEAAANGAGESVVTVGRLTVEPNGTNVIPGRVVFSIDARSPHEDRITAVETALERALADVQERRNVRVAVERLEQRPAAPMHAQMRAAIRTAIERLDRTALDIPSGAGHDAMCLARVAPTGMIFVPSIGGHSHVGRERTSEADLRLGVQALAAALLETDKIL